MKLHHVHHVLQECIFIKAIVLHHVQLKHILMENIVMNVQVIVKLVRIQMNANLVQLV